MRKKLGRNEPFCFVVVWNRAFSPCGEGLRIEGAAGLDIVRALAEPIRKGRVICMNTKAAT